MNALPCTNEAADSAAGQSQDAKLRVIQGGVLLGRTTGIAIDESDFRGNSTIIKMSAASVAKQVVHKTIDHRREEFVVKDERPATIPPEIVKTVLAKSHRNLGEVMLRTVQQQVDDEYSSFEAEVRTNGMSLIARAAKEQTAQHEKTDLLRGMAAFTDATQEHWGTLYDDTVLYPAQTFARWLLAIEAERPELNF